MLFELDAIGARCSQRARLHVARRDDRAKFDQSARNGTGSRNGRPQATQACAGPSSDPSQPSIANNVKQMRMRRQGAWVWFVALVVGCGPGNGPTAAGISTNEAYHKGLDAADAKDWATAEKQLSAALRGTGLQADEIEQALLARVRARLATDDLDGARHDLNQLDQGAGQMDLVWLLKCELAIKQGDEGMAQVAFQEAKKQNPRVKPPEGYKP